LEPLGVIAEDAPGLGERAVFGRAVEQPFPDFFLETPDGLADGGLGAVKLGRGPGKAPLGGNREKYA
jgi:hypothetical protein